MKNILFLSISILTFSCDQGKPQTYQPTQEFISLVEFEVGSMYNNTHAKEFLEFVAAQDEKYRSLQNPLLLKNGVDSEEYKDNQYMIIKTDAENLMRVESFLKKFGHPNMSFVGGVAARAPFNVILHSSNYDVQAKYFGDFYRHYLNRKVRENDLETYMDQMYELKFGTTFKMPSPYKMKEKFDTLISVLELRQFIPQDSTDD